MIGNALKVLAVVLVLPMISLAGFSGNGTAGCGSVAQQAELLGPGGGWCYTWSDCGGRSDCLPMVRERDRVPGFDWNPEQTVEIMHTCGSKPCAGLLMLNDPLRAGQDEGCNANCQATTLHDYAPVALGENPRAFIIFGNYARTRSDSVQPFIAAWQKLYPSEDLRVFLRQYRVRIGTHDYSTAQYTPQQWQSSLLSFQRWVRQNLGVGIVVTEWGGLSSGQSWKTVIADQKPWLTQRGIMNAVYIDGTDAFGYCCPMLLGDGLSEYGTWYKDH